jgi:mono/diheme cytochrome c family protein
MAATRLTFPLVEPTNLPAQGKDRESTGMRLGLIVGIALSVVAALAAGGWYLARSGVSAPDAADPARLAMAKQLYDQHCASCHGANLEGEADWQQRRADGTLPAPPQDASGHTWHHPDEQLFAITKQGIQAFAGPDYKTNMKGFGGVLGDDEIRAVLDYIKSRWPEEIRAQQAEITRRAEGG